MLESALGVPTPTTINDIKHQSVQRSTTSFSGNNPLFLAASSDVRQSDTHSSLSRLSSTFSGMRQPDNEFFLIQEEYLGNLESQYNKLQSMKQAKKFQVIRAITKI